MCLIIRRPRDVEIPIKLLINAFSNNSDGFGYMFAENGRVQVRKFLPKNPQSIIKAYDQIKDHDVGIHFRMATHGTTNQANCHPFQVLSVDKHGRDLWLMHNGILSSVPQPNLKKSDTWHFVTNWLRPVLEENPELIDDAAYQQMLAKFIGTGNKLLLLDGNGKFITINEAAGTLVDNRMWLSNLYSLDAPTSYRSYAYGGWYGSEEISPISSRDLTELLEDDDTVLGGACEIQSQGGHEKGTWRDEDTGDEDAWSENTRDGSFRDDENALYGVDVARHTISDLREMNESELFNWVIEHPEEATDVLTWFLR